MNRYVPLRGDLTLRSVHPELQCLQCDRTLPVVIFPLWNLTGVDRTLALSVRPFPDDFT